MPQFSFIKQFFLWSGIGAIEDLEDDDAFRGEVTYEVALAKLKEKTAGDWTLWCRHGDSVQLLAMNIKRGRSRLTMEIGTEEGEVDKMQMPFGQHAFDRMSDEELKTLKPNVQQYAMDRRRDHVLSVEKDHVAVIVGDRRHGLGYHVKGVVLLPRDERLHRNMEVISEILGRCNFDCTAATELRHLGIPILGCYPVDSSNPCSFIHITPTVFGTLRPGESGRTSVRYPFSMDGSIPESHAIISKGRMESNNPSVQNIPKEGVTNFTQQAVAAEEMMKNLPPDGTVFEHKLSPTKGWPQPANIDFVADLIYLCQHCGQKYNPAESTSEHTNCFCTGLCQAEYLATHKRMPSVGSEIPLGEPMLCNLHNMEVSPEVMQNLKALGSKKLGSLEGYGELSPSVVDTIEKVWGRGEEREPVVLPKFTPKDEQILRAMAGSKIHGGLTLPSGTHIPSPPDGKIWLVEPGGTIVESVSP